MNEIFTLLKNELDLYSDEFLYLMEKCSNKGLFENSELYVFLDECKMKAPSKAVNQLMAFYKSSIQIEMKQIGTKELMLN